MAWAARPLVFLAAGLLAGCPRADDGRVAVELRRPESTSAPADGGAARHVRATVALRDGSVLEVEVLDEPIEIVTPYGSQIVPLGRVRALIVGARADEPAVVETRDDLRLAGALGARALQVRSPALGSRALALSDVHELRAQAEPTAKVARAPSVDAAPATLDDVPGLAAKPPGTVVRYELEGALTMGPVYGTGTYSTDSSLVNAAVHAGLVRVGERATVEIEILGEVPSFRASTQHGVTSLEWTSPYPAFRFGRVRRAGGS